MSWTSALFISTILCYQVVLHLAVQLPDSGKVCNERLNSVPTQIGESLSESYFMCLGQQRYCSDKITYLVNNATHTSVIHYESAFTEVRDTCEKIATLAHQTQDLAHLKLQELSNISDEAYIVSERDAPVKHDPVKRPENVSEGQINYLIHIGPCQPKLSAYPKNTELAKKAKQCLFSPTWYKDYPYLEYTVSSDKAYCYVCKMFGKGCVGCEKFGLPWQRRW
jgi:hypothetical protein